MVLSAMKVGERIRVGQTILRLDAAHDGFAAVGISDGGQTVELLAAPESGEPPGLEVDDETVELFPRLALASDADTKLSFASAMAGTAN